MNALIRQFRGRPSSIVVGTCTIFVSIHDEAFLRELRAWKARLRYAHPDAILSRAMGTNWERIIKGRQLGELFKVEHARFEKWLKREKAWYASFGIEPPDHNAEVICGDVEGV